MKISRFVLSAAIAAAAGITSAQTLTDGALTVTSLRTSGSLSQPTGMIMLGTDDFLVCEKASGQVKRMTNGTVSGTIALDLAVNSDSERGLLALIADPAFSTNNFVYVYYTPSSTAADTTGGSIGANHIVARYTWNSGTGLLGSATTIVGDIPITSGPNHDGGIIVFGPPSDSAANQKLFAITGDLNRSNKTENFSAGADADGSGSIIRVNQDGSTPTDGPFFSVPGANSFLQRQYAYGIRNSFGMTFDALSSPNNLWETENGPSVYDEINFVAPAFNSGWRYIMGPQAANSFQGAPGFAQFGGVGTYSDPEFSFQQPIAITSIHFFNGAGLGLSYVGDCFVGDSNTGSLYKFEMNPSRTGFMLSSPLLTDLVYDGGTDSSALSEIRIGTGFGAITSLQTGPDGKLYVLSLGFGQIYRIANPASVPDWEML